MIRPEFIVEELRKNFPGADLDIIWRAYAFAARCHKGQKRVSGEPYLNHPLEVSNILAKMKLDGVSVTAGLLHDTLEDTFATPDEIRDLFGEETLQLVDGVTKLSRIESAAMDKEARQAENVRKMIMAMSKDIRVILIKLADRLHNLRTLDYLKPENQKRIAQETMDIYTPLANRLGIGWIKSEMENSCFKYLWPNEYSEIKHKVELVEAEREKYIDQIVSDVQERLTKEGVGAEVTGRPKHFFSIFSKMKRQKITFEEVFDLMGARVITNTDPECYAALGLIHSMYKPIPGKLKDYIALPKGNLYQSLHTTIVGAGGKPVEIQIRSRRMHAICEQGIAAHWKYKEGSGKDKKLDDQVQWLRRLMEWQQEVADPREFLEKVKIDLFPDEVYVFTPKQDVRPFPRGSTPIDFAYAIHTNIGDHIIGAKINGKLTPLRQELRNGDIVEILTSQSQRPSRDWLKFVVTAKARTKITAYLRQMEKQRAYALGKELMEKEMARHGVGSHSYMEDVHLLPAAQAVGYTSAESMLVAIGMGKLKLSAALAKILPKEALADREKRADADALKKIEEKPQKASKNAGVKIQDMDDMLIKFAHCCNPVPGDAIRGFISRGKGLVVHTADCPNALNLGLDSERFVEVEWDIKSAGKHQVTISVVTEDKPGMLANVSAAIADNGSNITEASIAADQSNRGYIHLTIEIADLGQLRKIMGAVMRQPGVISVERVRDKNALRTSSRLKHIDAS
ncbi:MAG: bifunctional (p)ppGpp synthetase/guanosine-3',5'-bis(diphosphate) 3'-pyrophosphohydrolase [Nitrospinae bacterium]|nr:bifunctional (p)ppGpp synthetase/guanosine-3',5'-bis(diphosphate) 3'-pyrophosphohydrolase [Nitrospinota bacterium]